MFTRNPAYDQIVCKWYYNISNITTIWVAQRKGDVFRYALSEMSEIKHGILFYTQESVLLRGLQRGIPVFTEWDFFHNFTWCLPRQKSRHLTGWFLQYPGTPPTNTNQLQCIVEIAGMGCPSVRSPDCNLWSLWVDDLILQPVAHPYQDLRQVVDYPWL